MSSNLNELQNATVGMTVGVIEVRFCSVCLFVRSFVYEIFSLFDNDGTAQYTLFSRFFLSFFVACLLACLLASIQTKTWFPTHVTQPVMLK